MNKFPKKNKIVDCFFFYDELEMLKFRLKELSPFVDFFIIIEGMIDFKDNPKKINIDLQDTFFDDYREKVIHLIYNKFDKNSLKKVYQELKYEKKLVSFEDLKLDKSSIVDYALYNLREKILSLELQFDDIILVSDVDEIPDLYDSENLYHNLKFDSLILMQTNFVWSTEFFDTYPHLGTCVFNKSKLITDPKSLLFNYELKMKSTKFPSIVVNNGYHFAHFYDYERTLNKLNLIYKPTDSVALTKTEILESMKNMTHPCQIKKPYLRTLVEYFGPLPKNVDLLNSQTIGRIWSKNFLILVNPSEETKENNSIKDYQQHFLVNFTSEYIKRTKSENEYDIFPPSEIYYLYDDETFLEKYKYLYCLNEINKIIARHLLLSHDFVIISLENYIPSSDEIKNNLKKNLSYFDHEKKYAILKWEILRDNIISDVISEIL